ncbi:unnamed protein product [Ceratitis capitata]|uniref:(Mediterranean fruit fly) hypothetical protein n=1 Tax=Ceratitis capitata TaxID=7213 RepID=A0A811VJ24_CERCA|nr:unnamed protein product [Ceratitis capitata]
MKHCSASHWATERADCCNATHQQYLGAAPTKADEFFSGAEEEDEARDVEHKEVQMLCVVVCSVTHKDSEKTYLAKPQWRIVTLASALKTAT